MPQRLPLKAWLPANTLTRYKMPPSLRKRMTRSPSVEKSIEFIKKYRTRFSWKSATALPSKSKSQIWRIQVNGPRILIFCMNLTFGRLFSCLEPLDRKGQGHGRFWRWGIQEYDLCRSWQCCRVGCFGWWSELDRWSNIDCSLSYRTKSV